MKIAKRLLHDERSGSIRRNVHALWFAARHPDVPVLAKLVIGVVVAYALSPIDLVPDFIPVLGWLDDLVLVPFGLWLAIRLIPVDIWRECQARAQEGRRHLWKSMAAAAVILLIWIGIAILVAWLSLKAAGV
ncbi:MAG TPA: YkvA family protein [Gammaproteobacteria bacterium]